MPYITAEAEVWVDLDDFNDEELLSEVKRRSLDTIGPHGSVEQIIQRMYDLESAGRSVDDLRRELYYTALGRML